MAMAAAAATADSAALGSVAGVVGKYMGEAATVAAVFDATLAHQKCHRHH